MKNNRHSAKVTLRPGHITWVHIHAKFEDLLSTSAIISKQHLEQKEVLHQDFKPFGQKKTLSKYFVHRYPLYWKIQAC